LINASSIPVITSTISNPGCGASNGSIDIGVSSGVAPYTFAWSNGTTTEDIDGLGAGSFGLTVTDDNGCTVDFNTALTNTNAPAAATTTSDETCAGNDGSVDLSVTGTAPFTIIWSNGATTEDLNAVSSGIFDATITDANGCTTTVTAQVNLNCGLTLSTTVTDAPCGAGNGAIDMTVNGGTLPITYAWSNGATSEDLNGVSAGSYVVTVTDANGATAVDSATVAGSVPPSLAATTVNEACGSSNGSIDVTINNGSAPFTFAWSIGDTA
jgi:hypothetical protein